MEDPITNFVSLSAGKAVNEGQAEQRCSLKNVFVLADVVFLAITEPVQVG